MQINGAFLECLSNEYRARRSRNPAYSLRSFSRDLAISPGRLSQYFSETRPITPNAAKKIMDRLGLSPVEQARWIGITLQPDRSTVEPELLDQKIFELISDPLHFVILSLLETRSFKNDAKWIARRTRSSVPEVTASLKLLKQLGLMMEIDGKLAPTHKQGVRSSDGVQSAALRRSHRRQLEEAADALDRVPVELRDITAITFAADPSKLSEAKTLIKDFRRKLSQLFETKNCTEVYRLQVQLIPVTESEKENQKC
jgi:hypothetical protein